jgi:hypothetical protein
VFIPFQKSRQFLTQTLEKADLYSQEVIVALIHLIYISTANKPYESAELDSILESAVRYNTVHDVTGMLLYVGGSFMQVLEGEESSVDAAFARIRSDSRHDGILLIQRESIPQRSFDRWSMGFRRIGPADADAHPAFAPFFKRNFKPSSIGVKPGLALELLKDFGLSQREIRVG